MACLEWKETVESAPDVLSRPAPPPHTHDTAWAHHPHATSSMASTPQQHASPELQRFVVQQQAKAQLQQTVARLADE